MAAKRDVNSWARNSNNDETRMRRDVFWNFVELFWPKMSVVDFTNPPVRFHVEIMLGILTISC